jgi:PAS domain S-box-containing protein
MRPLWGFDREVPVHSSAAVTEFRNLVTSSGNTLRRFLHGWSQGMSTKASKHKLSDRRFRESKAHYRALFDNMVNGFAYHKMLFDDHGKPIDYIFLEVNEAFERLTGLKREEVIGKKATEVVPGLEREPGNWIGIYGGVALSGSSIRFETYSEALKKWYSVSAYSPKRGYFAALFEDITGRKQAEMLSKALNDIGLIINSTLDSDEIMNRVVVEVCKAIGAESAAISLRKGEGWTVASAYGLPQNIIGSDVADEEEPYAVLAMDTKQIVVIDDAFKDERVNIEHMRKHDIRSVIAVPLVTKDKTIGVLFLNQHTAPVPFTEAQRDFAEKLGYALALSLENAALLKAEKKRKERFQLLSDAASQLLATDKPQEIVPELCGRVMAHLDCDACLNYLVDEKKRRLRLNTCAGIPEQSVKEIEWLDYGGAVCGCAARDACPIVVEDIPHTPDSRTELIKSFGIKAYACYPLLTAERVIGTLAFGTRTRSSFSEEDLSLMKTVADQVAIAMEGKRLIAALGRSRDELETKVKERTAELARTNELLEKAFSSIDISLAYMDREFNFIRVNRAYAEADGHEPDFYVGKNHFAFFPNEENKRVFRKVVDTGEPYAVYAKPFEYAGHPERGLTYWDWKLQAVREPDRRVGGVVLSLVNVTERVRAQEAVRAERQRFNDVLESLPAYVVLLTPEYHVSFANRFYRERFGESRRLRCFEHLFGRTEPCEVCEIHGVLKDRVPQEWEWTGPDGRMYSVFSFPFTDTDGTRLILEMGIDITERKQAEAELRKKEKQIRFFASQCLSVEETERRRIAAELHDGIVSSLVSMKFRIERIAKDMKQGPDSLEAIQDLGSSLTQTLGEIRRIMADLRPSILDDLGILPALNWFCREYEKTYSSISVQKQFGVSEDEVPDSLKTAIFRIAQEALHNIAKHSKATLVSVSVQKIGERMELTVQDDGHGFQPDEIAKGLGLSTMRERTELSGGTFEISSTEGKGTTIRASWPV